MKTNKGNNQSKYINKANNSFTIFPKYNKRKKILSRLNCGENLLEKWVRISTEKTFCKWIWKIWKGRLNLNYIRYSLLSTIWPIEVAILPIWLDSIPKVQFLRWILKNMEFSMYLRRDNPFFNQWKTNNHLEMH